MSFGVPDDEAGSKGLAACTDWSDSFCLKQLYIRRPARYKPMDRQTREELQMQTWELLKRIAHASETTAKVLVQIRTGGLETRSSAGDQGSQKEDERLERALRALLREDPKPDRQPYERKRQWALGPTGKVRYRARGRLQRATGRST